MTTVKLVLDKRRKKKSGAYPLVIRIRKTGKYVDVLTNQELHEHQFDDKREIVLGNKSLNKFLQREVDICKYKIIQLEQQYDEVSFEQIKALFGKNQKAEPTIAEFWQQEAIRLIEIGKAGNASVYISCLNGLKRVMNLNIRFKELKHMHLLDAETKLLKNGVKLNTLSVYMRTLRAICNKAILVDLVDQSWYPFFRYKIKKGKSVPIRRTIISTARGYRISNLVSSTTAVCTAAPMCVLFGLFNYSQNLKWGFNVYFICWKC